jgi:hypothetical protein
VSTDPRMLMAVMRGLIVTLRDWSVSYHSTAEETGKVTKDIGDATEQLRNDCEGTNASSGPTYQASSRSFIATTTRK